MENGLYYDFSTQLYQPAMEFWRPVTNASVPGVRPYYWVSDWGRMYNTNMGRFMPQYDDGKRGYLLVTLATDKGNITKSVHRIVMIEFCGFDPDEDKDEVDHYSGIKYNNSIYNLHWVSGSENIIAAYDNGLMPSGEDSPVSKLSNDDVRHVCQMMQDGIDRNKIYEFLKSKGIAHPDTLMHAIYTRRTWKRISKDYIFKSYRERSPLTDSEVHIICQGLQNGLDQNSIMINLGLDVYNSSEDNLQKYRTAISAIKKGRKRTDISSQYNIDSDASKQVFTVEEIHYICKRFEDGASSRQILEELGHGDVRISKDYHEYYHYMNPIGKIKSRKMFTEISSQYNF